MSAPWTMRISEDMMLDLEQHLFPGDHNEHGAVIAASVLDTSRGTRLLARHLFLAEEGTDYVPGSTSHRHLTASYVGDRIDDCERENLAYFAVHCHGGTDSVGFSGVDLRSHERGYPALLDILEDKPVGGLVFARKAVAGDIWLPDRQRVQLDRLDVIGRSARSLRSAPVIGTETADSKYDRQTRLFGDRGQQILSGQKIGIIGLGGIGSLINEYLARLGVGEIIAIDPDHIEPSNLSRVVGSRKRDTRPFLTSTRMPKSLRRWAERRRTPKVTIAERVALEAHPEIRFTSIAGDVTNENHAARLLDCDYIFLAADTMQARLVFNEIVHQYLIPGVQVGAKVTADKTTGQITDVFSVSRQILPGHGCLWCNELISPSKLQEEAESDEQQRQQRYIEDQDVHAPSVITLNAVSAAHAVDEYLFSQLGLLEADQLSWKMFHPREAECAQDLPRRSATCPECVDRLGVGPTRPLMTKAG